MSRRTLAALVLGSIALGGGPGRATEGQSAQESRERLYVRLLGVSD